MFKATLLSIVVSKSLNRGVIKAVIKPIADLYSCYYLSVNIARYCRLLSLMLTLPVPIPDEKKKLT